MLSKKMKEDEFKRLNLRWRSLSGNSSLEELQSRHINIKSRADIFDNHKASLFQIYSQLQSFWITQNGKNKLRAGQCHNAHSFLHGTASPQPPAGQTLVGREESRPAAEPTSPIAPPVAAPAPHPTPALLLGAARGHGKAVTAAL